MKRLWVVAVAVLAGGSLTAAGTAREEAAGQRFTTICHKTTSRARPYVRLRVSARRLRAHQRHADDIIPAGRSCPRTLLTPAAGGIAASVTLTGVAQVPAPADPDATGRATIRLRLGQGRICFTLTSSDITLPAAGAHIHRGTAEQSGPIVVQLAAPGASGSARGCVAVSRALVREILQTPASFYVNVHTTDFPGGAVRGQLGTSTAVRVFDLGLSGAAERPNPGDPDGTGRAGLRLVPSTGEVCFTLAVRNILLPTTGAHIHRGGANEAGPIVVGFRAPDAGGTSSGCVTAGTPTVQEILQNPGNFYVNVHTREFPGGAIRSQLG